MAARSEEIQSTPHKSPSVRIQGISDARLDAKCTPANLRGSRLLGFCLPVTGWHDFEVQVIVLENNNGLWMEEGRRD